MAATYGRDVGEDGGYVKHSVLRIHGLHLVKRAPVPALEALGGTDSKNSVETVWAMFPSLPARSASDEKATALLYLRAAETIAAYVEVVTRGF